MQTNWLEDMVTVEVEPQLDHGLEIGNMRRIARLISELWRKTHMIEDLLIVSGVDRMKAPEIALKFHEELSKTEGVV